MHTLLLMVANSIPGAILFLVLVLILRQMPEENAIAESTTDAAPASPSGIAGRPADILG